MNASLSTSSLPLPVVVILCLLLLASRVQFFFGDAPVVTAHVDHVIGFSIFTVFHVSSLDQFVVNLFLGHFKRSVGRFFSKRCSVHRVECCEVLYHQPLLQPISSFVTLFECARANTGTLHSISWAQFGVEISSHNLYPSLTGIRVLLDCSVLVGIHRVEEVHRHQLDAMVVDRDRRSNGPFVDVFSVFFFKEEMLYGRVTARAIT